MKYPEVDERTEPREDELPQLPLPLLLLLRELIIDPLLDL